jgi:hypothetical protein
MKAKLLYSFMLDQRPNDIHTTDGENYELRHINKRELWHLSCFAETDKLIKLHVCYLPTFGGSFANVTIVPAVYA